MGGLGSGRRTPKSELRRARETFEQAAEDVARRIIKAVDDSPIICPNCGCDTGVRRINMEAAKLIIEQALGKPAQRVEMDIAHHLELSADQIQSLLERAQVERRAFLEPGAHDVAQREEPAIEAGHDVAQADGAGQADG